MNTNCTLNNNPGKCYCIVWFGEVVVAVTGDMFFMLTNMLNSLDRKKIMCWTAWV